jgi:hypothetical protein
MLVMMRVRSRVIAIVPLLVVVLLVVLVSAAQPNAEVVMRVSLVVRGDGIVTASPGNRRCTDRCTWKFAAGVLVRLAARPAIDSSFSSWLGACSGRKLCTFGGHHPVRVVAQFRSALSSWNPHVSCVPTLTTLEAINGSATGPTGGALESGGAFQPHLGGDAQRHLLDPPCSIGGRRVFVQINNVVVGDGWERSSDGDLTGPLFDPLRPDITNRNLVSVHAEVDATWASAKVAPPDLPPAGTRIDLQGFVYWDPGHTNDAWHFLSGWEIHPLSAWRPSRGANK